MFDHTWLLENALSAETFLRLVNVDEIVNDHWTAQDEADFQDEVEVVRFKSLADLNEADFLDLYGDELVACRVIGSIYGVLPSTFLSINNSLIALGNWSGSFSSLLTRLAVQPFFEHEIGSLVTAHQYAVICRTGSRESWPLRDVTDDAFLTILIKTENARTYHDTRADQSPIDMRKFSAGIWQFERRDRPEVRESKWSRLFAEIELRTEHSGIHTGGPYPVTKDDLNVVLGAVCEVESKMPAYTACGIRDWKNQSLLDSWYNELYATEMNEGPLANIPPLTIDVFKRAVIRGAIRRQREHAKLESGRITTLQPTAPQTRLLQSSGNTLSSIPAARQTTSGNHNQQRPSPRLHRLRHKRGAQVDHARSRTSPSPSSDITSPDGRPRSRGIKR
jgi:hypothetical protein